jgi:hypothetical protein
VRMLELGHARCMIIPRAWRGVRPPSTRPFAVWEPLTPQAEHENPGSEGRNGPRPPGFRRCRPRCPWNAHAASAAKRKGRERAETPPKQAI